MNREEVKTLFISLLPQDVKIPETVMNFVIDINYYMVSMLTAKTDAVDITRLFDTIEVGKDD